jgi:spore coat polysaccharide biosynthesis protein SpsF (cytidylyltransferase family)
MSTIENNSGILIQARMSSSRLPGKVLMNIGNLPALTLIMKRCQKAELINMVIVVTSTQKEDDKIEELTKKYRVECFRGSLHDVLRRYIDAAEKYAIKQIVRVCGDSPFVLPEIIDESFRQHTREGNDYTNAIDQDIITNGTGVEMVTLEALNTCYKEGGLKGDRENVTKYIRQNPGEFKYGRYKPKKNKVIKGINLLLDTREDYEKLLQFVTYLPQNKPLEDVSYEDLEFAVAKGAK